MKNITSSSTCGTGLLQLQNNLSNSELDVAVVGKPEAGALLSSSLTLSLSLSPSVSLPCILFFLHLSPLLIINVRTYVKYTCSFRISFETDCNQKKKKEGI